MGDWMNRSIGEWMDIWVSGQMIWFGGKMDGLNKLKELVMEIRKQ